MVLWLWLAWFGYCVLVVPTWCFVFLRLRPGRGRFVAWAIASGCALAWPLFVPQYKVWERRHVQVTEETWVDQLERELHATA